MSKLLYSVGLLTTGKVVVVQRTDLVGEYMGQTGPKTRAKVNEATGSVLFIDEAYSLAPVDATRDYGKQALEEIMSVMEDGNPVIIFAGYTELMENVFSVNRGLKRRVSHVFKFDDYTCDQLAEILLLKMNKQDEKSRLHGFKLDPSCTHKVVGQVIEKHSTEKLRKEMNGGLIDHVLNNAKENLDSRLSLDSENIDEMMTITLSDLEAGLKVSTGKKVPKGKTENITKVAAAGVDALKNNTNNTTKVAAAGGNALKDNSNTTKVAGEDSLKDKTNTTVVGNCCSWIASLRLVENQTFLYGLVVVLSFMLIVGNYSMKIERCSGVIPT